MAREGSGEASGVADEPALAAALRCWCTEIPTFFSNFPNQFLEFSVFTARQGKHKIFVGFLQVCRSIIENGLDIKTTDMKFTTLRTDSLFA